MVVKAVQDACEGPILDSDFLERCVRERPEERPGSDEVQNTCEEQVHKLGGKSGWPEDDELCNQRFGVYRREELPGEATSDGWLIAPKFKLAYDDLDIGDLVAEGGFSEIYKVYKKKREKYLPHNCFFFFFFSGNLQGS